MRATLPLIMALCFFVFPAMAEDKKKEASEKQTPITEWLAAESAVVEGLETKDAKETYFILRNKYSVIRAIRVVKSDIGDAVQACGQENPDIQDKMNTRYKDWKNAVDPILKTAEGYLRQEIKEQDVVKSSTFYDMLEMNDDAFEYQQDLLDKKPITDVAACEKLLNSMDATEESMLRLMQDVLLPTAVIQKQTDKN